MQQNNSSVNRRRRKTYAKHAGAVLLAALVFTGCSKQELEPLKTASPAKTEIAFASSLATEPVPDNNILGEYTGLPQQTAWELQQARAATARYRRLENALADGYVDINVIVPGMGFHYLKAGILDAEFDFRKPEILVYNRESDGSFILVAVEYAVPINLSPNTAPEGFTGNLDVWDYNTNFQLWLLHAWVWAYNPLGVFNPVNPLVHLH